MSGGSGFDKKRWRALQALSRAVAKRGSLSRPERPSVTHRRAVHAKPRREREAQAVKDGTIPYVFRNAKSARRYGLLDRIVVHRRVRGAS